jgi:hypothetical protein
MGSLESDVKACMLVSMEYELTRHAADVLKEREIRIEWMEKTLFEPELILADPEDDSIERRFCRIPENGNRVLRVAVNVRVEPGRVVSVFFDRTMRGRL